MIQELLLSSQGVFIFCFYILREEKVSSYSYCDYHTLSTFGILDYNNDQDLWERKETCYYTYWTSYCELLSYYSIAT